VELKLPFILNDEEVHGGSYLQWFKYEETARIMRDMLVQPSISQQHLTIGMVNRLPRSGRHLVNADEICSSIQKELGIKVSITFFEDKSFEYQIQFFRDHQIIIGPHGAHLANIPFSPDNALILECCDEWQPYEYFSGLAHTCKKYHVIFRPSHDTFPSGRQENTKKNVHCCPQKILKVIQTYVKHLNRLPSRFTYLK
jgi:hypothetical protein